MKKFGKWGWWVWPMMRLSGLPLVGRRLAWMAGLPLGHYESRRQLAQIRTYISPRAQINCPDLQIGPHCYIDDFVTIYGETGGSVVLGEKVRIRRGCIIEARHGGKVIIGDDSGMYPYCTLYGVGGNLRIGKRVGFASYCSFIPAQHIFSDLDRPAHKQGVHSKGDIIIEDDAWLGMGVRVMDGVRIGEGAVIGANAVVTKDIPPYSIAVGVPARVIGKRGEGKHATEKGFK
jgi:acetyltransferase-like isoleucine patch superfamily enzyme